MPKTAPGAPSGGLNIAKIIEKAVFLQGFAKAEKTCIYTRCSRFWGPSGALLAALLTLLKPSGDLLGIPGWLLGALGEVLGAIEVAF